MDRIQRLDQKIKELSDKVDRMIDRRIDPYVVFERPSTGRKILATSIIFASFMGLFITGIFFGWHWGWLVSIGVVGFAVVSFMLEL